MKRIGLIGYFGWGNFGDELFVKVHRQRLGDTFDLDVTHDLLEAPYYSRPVSEVAEEFDGFLLGGGDLLNPLRVSELYWNMDYLRKPVFVHGLGVPNQPFRRDGVIEHYRRFLGHENCKVVIARDVESHNWLKENLDLGDKLHWYPDPVCAMDKPAPTPSKDKVLGVVMREHRSLDQEMGPVRALIDQAKEQGYKIKHLVLASMSLGQADLSRAQLIAESGEEIVQSEDLDELCQAVSACSHLASIKFHGLVVATMYGVPSIAMSVTPKNRNFLRMIERPEMLCSYTEPTLQQRLPHHPARIHNRVRSGLYNQAVRGYQHLQSTMEEVLGA